MSKNNGNFATQNVFKNLSINLLLKSYSNMKLKHLLLLALLPLTLAVSAQDNQKKNLETYVIGFYNLENLFDTIDSPDTNDAEYLPNGRNSWGTMKYLNKLDRMSYALSKFPKELAVLGVSEIENINVLEDLVRQPAIKERNLQPILIEGPDRRGVDVGLLYNPSFFTPTNVVSHRLQSSIENFTSRDQLCVTGDLAGEQIHIIVLHWPSKYGGETRSKPRRKDAALTTKWICDSIFKIEPEAKIVVMGDLNDNPDDDSVFKHLGAKGDRESVQPGELYNPDYKILKSGTGSLGYQDVWCLYDQVIVSHAWLDRTNLTNLTFWKAEIFNKDFLKEESGKRKGYPLRTHSGGVWTNGYSDHFPSLIWVVKSK